MTGAKSRNEGAKVFSRQGRMSMFACLGAVIRLDDRKDPCPLRNVQHLWDLLRITRGKHAEDAARAVPCQKVFAQPVQALQNLPVKARNPSTRIMRFRVEGV